MRNPTTSPRVGLYITKPGRRIYFGLTPLPRPDLFAAAAYMYARRVYGERKEGSVRSRCSTETRSFSLIRISRGCFKVERSSRTHTSSPRQPPLLSFLVDGSSVSSPLDFILARRVIDFSPTVHSPLNNAPRSPRNSECPSTRSAPPIPPKIIRNARGPSMIPLVRSLSIAMGSLRERTIVDSILPI